MKKYKIKISSKGQIAIPKKIRDQWGTYYVEMELKDDELILRPAPSILELGGILKEHVTDASQKEKESGAWEAHVRAKYLSD